MEPDLHVRTDLVPAQALVRNLVSNAVKSARRRVVVTVVVAQAPDAVRIGVRDDGPGLPEAAIALLDGVTGSDRAQSWMMNSGLGLRLCVEIAQVLQTRLEPATAPGGGTEISLTLARADA